MKIIGLSGGVASGKNFVADIFKKNGAAIFDADYEVHQLLKLDSTVIKDVQKNFPQAVVDQIINRKVLGKIVFSDEKKLKILEKIIHSKVRERYQEFLKSAQKESKKIAVLNIPLLLESESYRCDKIIAITASPSIQKKRFLARAKKSDPKNFLLEKKNLENKFEQIRAQQITNIERKSRADFVVNSSLSKSDVNKQVKRIESLL